MDAISTNRNQICHVEDAINVCKIEMEIRLMSIYFQDDIMYMLSLSVVLRFEMKPCLKLPAPCLDFLQLNKQIILHIFANKT